MYLSDSDVNRILTLALYCPLTICRLISIRLLTLCQELTLLLILLVDAMKILNKIYNVMLLIRIRLPYSIQVSSPLGASVIPFTKI